MNLLTQLAHWGVQPFCNHCLKNLSKAERWVLFHDTEQEPSFVVSCVECYGGALLDMEARAKLQTALGFVDIEIEMDRE